MVNYLYSWEPQPPACCVGNGQRADGYIAGNHGHPHAADNEWWMEGYLAGNHGHPHATDNEWWMEGYLAGNQDMTYYGKSVANGWLPRRVPQLLGTWPTGAWT